MATLPEPKIKSEMAIVTEKETRLKHFDELLVPLLTFVQRVKSADPKLPPTIVIVSKSIPN